MVDPLVSREEESDKSLDYNFSNAAGGCKSDEQCLPVSECAENKLEFEVIRDVKKLRDLVVCGVKIGTVGTPIHFDEL